MRLLVLGDIVGQPGVEMVKKALPALRRIEGIGCVIANAENASGGSGMTPRVYRQLRQAGIDLVTMGDHIYKKQELIEVLQEDASIGKPANFPKEAPGRPFISTTFADGAVVAAFCLLGRTFMRPVDCPFAAADQVLATLAGKANVVIVDVHAEATADKYLLGHHLKGRVSAVVGTHTHVQTADEQILAGGTAYITDLGMTGPYDSILGRRIDRVLHTTRTFLPTAFDVAEGDPRLAGVILDCDPATGQAHSIKRLMLDETGLQKLLAAAT
jgi:metallophosphoesterase (TIGR00282 family)